MKTVFITGATSGIGLATAKKLASKYKLILCGRRADKLAEIENELAAITSVKTLVFDVSNKDSVFNAIESLPTEWKNIDILINNAGNAHGLASFQEAEITDLEAMIDINVKGLIYVTKAVLPFLLKQNSGHIINLSSIAGKEVYANGTTYCASKWAVEALTKGMRLDLLSQGIKVTSVAPGAVETEFSLVRFRGDQEKSANVYKGFDPLVAENIADTIYFVLSQPDHVQIADITVLPKAQGDGRTINKNL